MYICICICIYVYTGDGIDALDAIQDDPLPIHIDRTYIEYVHKQ